MGVVRHAWSCSKLWQIVSQLYLNNKLSYKVRDWPSGLRRYIQNRKDPGSNHTRCLVMLLDPTSLRGSLWPHRVIEATPSTVAQSWLCSSQVVVKKMFFCMLLRIHRSYTFIQSLQVGAQSYWEQISNITEENLGMNLSFCMWLDMHKLVYMIQFFLMGVVKHTWTCQK